MLLFSPYFFLFLIVAITAITASSYTLIRRQREFGLIQLAKQWKMHFSPKDVFNLAPRLASRLPIPGAAEVRVRDMIYGNESAGHRYIFCAEFTVGVLQSKSRRHVVATVLEPRERGDASIWATLQFAPVELPLIEQYRSLKKE